MSIHKLSFAVVLSSSVILCSQLDAQSSTTQETPATAAPQVVQPSAAPQAAQPAATAPQVDQPAAATTQASEPAAAADATDTPEAPDVNALKDKCGMVMGYNLARNWKSQNPNADYNEVLKGMKAADADEDRSSYVFGYQMMTRMKEQNVGISADQLEVGLKKAMAGEELGMTDQEVQVLMMSFGRMVEENRIAEMKKTVEDNKAAGEAYIAEQKAANPNLKELGEGVYYEVLTEGTGPKPGPNAKVSVDYTGTFIDGEVFDSSVKPVDGGPGEPAEFEVGRVIPGFTQSLLAMPVGSKWRVIIPGEKGYGVKGSGGKIGPMQTLIFELELLGIVDDGTKAATAGSAAKAPAMKMTPEIRAAIEAQMKAAAAKGAAKREAAEAAKKAVEGAAGE